jgi:hypothetical protein
MWLSAKNLRSKLDNSRNLFMKKFKGDVKTIAEILIVILIYFGIASFDAPFISYLAIGLCVIAWTYGLLEKYQYRKGKSSYILIPTNRDDYSKLTSCVLGVLIVVGCIVYSVFISKSFNYFMALSIIAGLLIFFNGLFDLPKARVEIKKNQFAILGKGKLHQADVSEIEITNERLNFKHNSGQNLFVDDLKLDKDSVKKVIQYIKADAANKHIAIHNHVR